MSALNTLITRRWSPYAFCSKTRVEAEKLSLCFEAARWAPSSYNEQPWHIVYADKFEDPVGHARLLSFMVEFNQQWAQHAPIIGLIATHHQSDLFKRPNPHSEYDCGAAMSYLTIQATELGLSVHQMAGFDPVMANKELILPEGYTSLTVFALGYMAEVTSFLPQLLQERHEKQKNRIRKAIPHVVSKPQFK